MPKKSEDPGSQLALLTTEKTEELKSWALIELFGHQTIIGWMTSNPPELPGMIRVDVPDLVKDGKIERKGFTRYFGRAALYSVTPIDEETVRRMLPAFAGLPAARPLSISSYAEREY
jgi:hypothetical protein